MMTFDLEAWLRSSPPESSSGPQLPPIVQAGAAVLRRAAFEVAPALLGTAAFERLLELMVDAMRAAPGVGLAAPQLGVPLRVFVAEDTEQRMAHQSADARTARGRTGLPLLILINPTVTPASELTATFYEGCLSVRGYGALVRRASAVTVTGLDPRGAPLAFQVEGWPARIMQHEMDHLDGTLYVDRMISRSLAGEAELARLAGLPVEEVLGELGAEGVASG